MLFNFNGIKPKNIMFNNQKVKQMFFNGVKVWSGEIPFKIEDFVFSPLIGDKPIREYQLTKDTTYTEGSVIKYYKYNKSTTEYTEVTGLVAGDSVVGYYNKESKPQGSVIKYPNKVGVFEYNGTATEISLPETINGKQLYYISDVTFKNKPVTNVVWGKGVSYIEKDAFVGTAIYNNEANWVDDCLKVNNAYVNCRKPTTTKTIIIPKDVEIIAYETFRGLNQLESVEVRSNIKTGCRVFDRTCGNLNNFVKLIINPSVTTFPGIVDMGDTNKNIYGFGGVTIPNHIHKLTTRCLIGDFAYRTYTDTFENPVTLGRNITEAEEWSGRTPYIQFLKIDMPIIFKSMFESAIDSFSAINRNTILTDNVIEIQDNAFKLADCLRDLNNSKEPYVFPKNIKKFGSACIRPNGTSQWQYGVKFMQPAGMAITLPQAGEATGLFYNKSAYNLTIYTDNETIKNYNYAGDNVTPIFYHLDGSAWA